MSSSQKSIDLRDFKQGLMKVDGCIPWRSDAERVDRKALDEVMLEFLEGGRILAGNYLFLWSVKATILGILFIFLLCKRTLPREILFYQRFLW